MDRRKQLRDKIENLTCKLDYLELETPEEHRKSITQLAIQAIRTHLSHISQELQRLNNWK